jgi:hypothetical protein
MCFSELLDVADLLNLGTVSWPARKPGGVDEAEECSSIAIVGDRG